MSFIQELLTQADNSRISKERAGELKGWSGDFLTQQYDFLSQTEASPAEQNYPGFEKALSLMVSQSEEPLTTPMLFSWLRLLGPKESLLETYRKEKLPRDPFGYRFPAPEEIDHFMSHLTDQLRSSSFSLHPIELAAMAHKRLMDIQPYALGNLPMALLLMNRVLLSRGFSMISIPADLSARYLEILRNSRKTADLDPFTQLVAEQVIEAQKALAKACLL